MGHKELPFKHFITNREDYDRLVEKLHDPDAERFRWFAAAFMSAANDAPSEQAMAFKHIVDEYQPITVDDLRACIDAAKILIP